MGIKVGQYFAEGSNTNVKSSLHKKRLIEVTIENISIKDETFIYSTKYVTTYFSEI